MAKLTLSVDEGVVSRAKRYARRRGVSVSEMVEAYLDAVSRTPSTEAKETPVLRSLRGCLKKADPAAYGKYLSAKYR